MIHTGIGRVTSLLQLPYFLLINNTDLLLKSGKTLPRIPVEASVQVAGLDNYNRILLSTTAVARMVEVQSGASLSISSARSLPTTARNARILAFGRTCWMGVSSQVVMPVMIMGVSCPCQLC